MAKHDGGGPKQCTREQESEIRDEQGKQHENETANHRDPMAHAFSIGKRDETEPAEDQAANAVCRKRIRHAGFTAYRAPKTQAVARQKRRRA